MPFTLIFLGTDTVYSATDDHLGAALQGLGIKAQQTLSGVAGYIEPSLAQTAPILFSQDLPSCKDVHVLNNQVVVIDGPDTTGQVVHDKIGKGLVVILDAIIRGETVINIIGFSRGAVEALITMHELQRMQDALLARTTVPTPAEMWDIFASTVVPWCSNHLTSYHKNRILPLLLANHITTLQRWFCESPEAIALYGLAVDPVPGLADGSQYNPIAWLEPRHYYVPKIVARLDVIYQEDERTVGFIPIWIDNKLPTNNSVNTRTVLRHYHLPGFHGTPDGNPFDHGLSNLPVKSGEAGPLVELQTRDVQTVVFYLILDFLESTGVSLIAPPEQARFYLDTLYSPFKSRPPIEREQLYFACYQNMLQNIGAYREFRSKHYPYLSVEEKDKERKVKTSMTEVKTLSECFDGIKIIERPEAFINAHHFLLAFNRVRIPETLSHSLPDHQQLSLRMRHFLGQFMDHTPDSDLNILVKHSQKDRYKIVTDVIRTAPQRLARYYYSTHTPMEDCVQLGEIINQLLVLSLSEDGDELIIKKRVFLLQLQANMREAMVTEALGLLDMIRSWTDENWSRILPTQRVNSLDLSAAQAVSVAFSPEDERLFMQQAETYYLLLLRFTQHWHAAPIDQIVYRALHQQLMLFPSLCEGFLTRLGWTGSGLNASTLEQKIMSYHHADMLENAPKLVALRQEIAKLREVLSLSEAKLDSTEAALSNTQDVLKRTTETLTRTLGALSNERLALNGSVENVATISAVLTQTQDALTTTCTALSLSQSNEVTTKKELAQSQETYARLSNGLKQECQSCLSGLSWQIIGGFVTVLGVASVALALTCIMTLGSSSMLLVGSGIVLGGLLSSAGFYCVRKGAHMERDHQIVVKHDLANARMAGVV